MMEQLTKRNMRQYIVGFCDNSKEKWGRIDEFEIKSLHD